MPAARDQFGDVVRLEGKVRWQGRLRGEAADVEEENAKLERLLADAILDASVMKGLLAKTW